MRMLKLHHVKLLSPIPKWIEVVSHEGIPSLDVWHVDSAALSALSYLMSCLKHIGSEVSSSKSLPSSSLTAGQGIRPSPLRVLKSRWHMINVTHLSYLMYKGREQPPICLSTSVCLDKSVSQKLLQNQIVYPRLLRI